MFCRGVTGMAKKDTQITVRMTSGEKARLEAQTRRENRTASNLVHKVVRDYLTKEEPRP